MNLLETNDLANNADFRTKVKLVSFEVAREKLTAGGNAPFFTNYCQSVLTESDGGAWLPALVFAVLGDPGINAGTEVWDIKTRLLAVWLMYAKATYKITD